MVLLFAGKWLPAISTGGNYNNSGNGQCQLLGVCQEDFVDGSFCRNQHFLVGVTCRNRVIPGLEFTLNALLQFYHSHPAFV